MFSLLHTHFTEGRPCNFTGAKFSTALVKKVFLNITWPRSFKQLSCTHHTWPIEQRPENRAVGRRLLEANGAL